MVSNLPVFWTILFFNSVTCWALGAYTLRAKPPFPSKLSWGLCFLSYGTMPIFGGGDTFAGFEDCFICDGLSAFFSMSSVVFILSAALLDAELGFTFSTAYRITLGAVISLLAMICLVPELLSARNLIYPYSMVPVGAVAVVLFARKAWSKNIASSWWPTFYLLLGCLLEALGFLSVVNIFGAEFRRYGWYLFCWLGVVCMWLYWYTIRGCTLRNEAEADADGLNLQEVVVAH